MMRSHMYDRLAGILVVAFASFSLVLLGCSDPDVHDSDEPASEWTIVTTSEDLDSQVIVNNETGLQYVAIVASEVDGCLTSGLCERYGSDGEIMHDGDPTNGGSFDMEFIEDVGDASGGTYILRDSQTGVAYRWHRWDQTQKANGGQGLVPCRDKDGRIQKWDDDMLISIPVPDGSAYDPVVGKDVGNEVPGIPVADEGKTAEGEADASL